MGRKIGGPGGGSEKGSGGSGPLVAVVLAGAVAAAGGGIGGGASFGGASSTSSVEVAGAQNLSVRKIEGKRAARQGRTKQAWQRMGWRSVKQKVRRDLNCVAHSFGEVREFFLGTPCRSLDRMVLGLGDGTGNVAVVSVVWVRLHTRGQAREFQRLIDVHGTGDVTPLGSALLGLSDVHFTGWHYDSRVTGQTITVAETENASGQVGSDVLDAAADVAAYLPRP